MTYCESSNDCTLEQKLVSIEIKNSDEILIQDLDITILNKRTGLELCSSFENESQRQVCLDDLKELEPGKYAIASSLLVEREIRNRDVLIVSFIFNEVQYSKEFTILLDNNGCHPVGINGSSDFIISN